MKQHLIDLWDNKLQGKAWQVKEEFIGLLSFIEDKGIKTVLEIGAYKGGSALGFLEVGCQVISIDIVKQPEIEELEKAYPDRYKFYIRQNFPHRTYILGDYDLIWIDAGHSYVECMGDFEEFLPYLRPGKYVAFHDIVDSELHRKQNCEVYQVMDVLEREEKYKYRRDFITDGTWGGISIIKL